jgi:DNA-3-methyladenine glycosylase II
MNDKHQIAQEHLLEVSKTICPAFHSIIVENGVLDVSRQKSDQLLVYLVRTVIGQQLSTSAARSIWSRVVDLLKHQECDLERLICEENRDLIQQCGISKNKVRAVFEIKKTFDQEPAFAEKILKSDYQSVVTRIESVWGLGRWSADMCAMFYCGLPDVLPMNDSAINKGAEKIFETRDLQTVAEQFSPYRTYMCLHIWRAIDGNYL